MPRVFMQYVLPLENNISVPNRDGEKFTYDIARAVAFGINYGKTDAEDFLNINRLELVSSSVLTIPDKNSDYFDIVFELLGQSSELKVSVTYRKGGYINEERELTKEDTDKLLKKIAEDSNRNKLERKNKP